MDWVQIYVVLILVVSSLLTVFIVGSGETTRTTPEERVTQYIISLPLMLPYVGRVFGWW